MFFTNLQAFFKLYILHIILHDFAKLYVLLHFHLQYVTLFASAFPLCSIITILFLFIEARSDMFKLLYLCRRPIVHRYFIVTSKNPKNPYKLIFRVKAVILRWDRVSVASSRGASHLIDDNRLFTGRPIWNTLIENAEGQSGTVELKHNYGISIFSLNNIVWVIADFPKNGEEPASFKTVPKASIIKNAILLFLIIQSMNR